MDNEFDAEETAECMPPFPNTWSDMALKSKDRTSKTEVASVGALGKLLGEQPGIVGLGSYGFHY